MVRNGGKLTVKKSTFDNNEVDESADVSGGAIKNFAGKLVISDSSLSTTSRCPARQRSTGGAIHAGDVIDIKRTLFAGNSAHSAV